MKGKKEIKVAVIDMNNGFPNLGIKGITDVLSDYAKEHDITLSADIFDLRLKNEIPGTDYDIYISSGGPGSPLDGKNETWENSFSTLLDDIEAYNLSHQHKKHVFLICYSFQLACRKYGIGKISRRKSGVFGILPVTLTKEGKEDIIFKGLPDPFYAVDSREWQVTNPDAKPFSTPEAQVLAIEKDRPGLDMERCMMSVRFSNEFAGTQFHPEANPEDIRTYLLEEDKKETVIADHGEEKYDDILSQLDNPNGVKRTRQQILPNFLTAAIQSLNS